MSGGSMEYLCYKVMNVDFDTDTEERQKFKKLLDLVANALHDIEWVDSGDYVPGDENQSIQACFDFICEKE